MAIPEAIPSGLNEAIFSRLKNLYGDKAKTCIPYIDSVKNLKGADLFFKEALKFDDIRILDFIIELIFASYFYNENYVVEIIPRSNQDKTPDLFISNATFRGFVEIKHIHKKHDGLKAVHPNELYKINILEEYGDPIRDERYCREKILEGFRQIQQFSGLKKTDVMIVAIWNSDEEIEEIEMKFSISHLIEEKNEFKDICNPKWIVYGSGWYFPREKTQFHVFQF